MRTVPPLCLFSRKRSILFTPLILSVLYQNNASFKGRILKSVTYPLNFGLFLLKQRFHGLKNKDFVEDYPHLDQMAFFSFNTRKRKYMVIRFSHALRWVLTFFSFHDLIFNSKEWLNMGNTNRNFE